MARRKRMSPYHDYSYSVENQFGKYSRHQEEKLSLTR